MVVFLRDKGQILWDVTMNTTYVHPINFLAPGSRDMHDANNKAVNYLFCALCQSEFDQVQIEDLACRNWEQLKNAYARTSQVQARLYTTY
jgi:formate dehydrogenase maturation protein FdhE